jgi:o-succinylbenzoate synthase
VSPAFSLQPAPDVVVYRLGMRTRFRGLTAREGVLLHGPAGWGEFSPFTEYDDAESSAWLRAAREAADDGWPAPVRDAIPVNVTVPAVDAATAHRLVTGSGGCRTAKVKVAERGQDVGAEIARLEAVRDALGPSGAIRIDANAAWDVPTAVARLRVLDRAAGGLEYAEQPVPTVADLAALRRSTHVPIAADESIRRAADPLAVARAGAADVVVLKVQPLGGVAACLRLAEEIGLPVVVSSALETSVGLAAGIALAAALPGLPYACGLATAQLLTADVVAGPLLPVGGAIAVQRPAPDPELLAAAAPPDDVRDRWLERLARVERVERIERSGRSARSGRPAQERPAR